MFTVEIEQFCMWFDLSVSPVGINFRSDFLAMSHIPMFVLNLECVYHCHILMVRLSMDWHLSMYLHLLYPYKLHLEGYILYIFFPVVCLPVYLPSLRYRLKGSL